MQNENKSVESPLNDHKKLLARQEVATVMNDPYVMTQVALELDASTVKLELARARIAAITDANIAALEAATELSEEDRTQAIAKQRVQRDQAEIQLENHVEWRQFVRGTFNI